MSLIDPGMLSSLLVEDLKPSGEVMLTSDMTIADANKLWLVNSFLKKFQESEAPDAHDKAIAKFLGYNDKCAAFRLEPKRLFDEELIGGVRATLDDWLHPEGSPAGLSEFLEFAELGPGASRRTEFDHFYTKLFDSGQSCANADLRVLYRTFITRNPTWAAAEEARRLNYGDIVVKGSSISTVPKQFDIKRTICTEPVLEMFFQRGIGNFMESVMGRRLGLRLDTQPDKNREFARMGSIDGSFGTIDLRSASDSISITLVKEVFPRYFVDWLMRTRCHHARLPAGEDVELHMISSMGNGFTFALQTMLFASIVVTCYHLMGIRPLFQRRRNRKGVFVEANAGVFGDDIVVRREAYSFVSHALGLFGFEVNDDKSFNAGNFRESCGSDYFRGVDIRGVYLKRLTQETDCFVAINRLTRWMGRTGLDLDLTVSALLGVVSFLPIPFRDGDNEGIKVPFALSQVSYFSTATRSPLYRARVTEGRSFPVPSDVDQLQEQAFRRIPYSIRYNGAGLLVSLVGGYIQGGRFSVREDVMTRSKVRLRTVPFWDYVPTAPTVQLEDGAWQGAVDRLFTRIAYPMGA